MYVTDNEKNSIVVSNILILSLTLSRDKVKHFGKVTFLTRVENKIKIRKVSKFFLFFCTLKGLNSLIHFATNHEERMSFKLVKNIFLIF